MITVLTMISRLSIQLNVNQCLYHYYYYYYYYYPTDNNYKVTALNYNGRMYAAPCRAEKILEADPLP